MLDAGRLVLQDDLATLRAPTGRVLVDTPDADQVAALLDGQVEQRDGSQLVVRHADAAALNARLVRAGIRVSADRPAERTLEEIVLGSPARGMTVDGLGTAAGPGTSWQPGTEGSTEARGVRR